MVEGEDRGSRFEACLDPREATLLFAEDTPSDRRSVAAALREVHWPAEVVYAKDGLDAWHVLQEMEQPIMVLTDLDMPQMGGLQLLQKIRRSDRFRGTPTFVLSRDAAPERIHECMVEGATAFFPKPFDAPGASALIHTLHAVAFNHCFPPPDATGGQPNH